MASSLSKHIAEGWSSAEKIAIYESYAKDSDTALQAILHMVSSWNEEYIMYKDTFLMMYTVWKRTFSNHKLSKIYTLAQANEIDLDFVIHDIQAPVFRELVTKHWTYMDQVTQDVSFSNLSYFVSSLQTITDRDFATQSWIDSYLQTSLKYHQKDLKKSSFAIIKQAQSQWYTKQTFLTMPSPKHELVVDDWAVSLANKDEVALYQKRGTYTLYQDIHTSPYFLFVWSATHSTFIWTHAYKQAILSYTSEKARSLRFEDSTNTTADLLIHQWAYKKIYIRGTDEDTSRWYDTATHYPDSSKDYTVNSFFESESWLSEISHLMTSNQDLIFRSPTVGTALVQWVSWSGKTNLIFHRIDYLLQELPDQFQAKNLMIFTPNEILAAYMQAALASTSFTFKEDISIESFSSFLTLPKPRDSTYQPSDTPHLNQQLTHIQSSIQKKHQAEAEKLINSIRDCITQAQQALHHTHTSKSSLEQHVHKNWYNKDTILLEQSLKNLNKISRDSWSTPGEYTTMILQAIQTALYQTYSLDTDTISLKQWYHDEIFEPLNTAIQDNIWNYQDTLLAPWIDIQTKILQKEIYTSKFQKLVSVLSDDENTLITEVVAVTIYQYLWKNIKYPKYQYVLIDEFQDFHPLALKLLWLLYGTSMILSWDFMQSAWYHEVSDISELWIQLVDHRTMRDNFRNTLETIQYAHGVFWDQAESLFLAKRVIKRWPKPAILKSWTSQEVVQTVNSLVKNLRPKETVAIIYYNKEYATTVYTAYTSQTTQEVLFPSLDTSHYQELITWYYSKQVYFISYRESKGLEFDHIILIDQQTLLDTQLTYKKKLWYIGCTRAVKTLSVVA